MPLMLVLFNPFQLKLLLLHLLLALLLSFLYAFLLDAAELFVYAIGGKYFFGYSAQKDGIFKGNRAYVAYPQTKKDKEREIPERNFKT